MRVRKENWIVFVAAISFLLLIFDAKTALVGASTGIEMCFRSIIPALFPFLVLWGLSPNAGGGGIIT